MGGAPTWVAVLFTDIVGSTRLWAEHYDAMSEDLVQHDAELRDAIERHGGRIFSTAGDSFAASFPEPRSAVDAAIEVQSRLAAAEWHVPSGIRVRTTVHAGEVIERGGDYFGPTLNVAARVMGTGHGGQILVTGAAATSLSIETVDLGLHRLRDIDEPLHIYQVGSDGLTTTFPPLRSTTTSITTLPQHRSSFVGRHDEIRRVRSLLADHRLVTLTGVGGVGKTRLAVEAAAAEQPAFPGGVFFVDLAPVTDPDAVATAVATGIGLSVARPDDLGNAIDRFLAPRTVLLVVDNCEHLLDEVAELLDELLAHAPGLRVLATSREALDLEGEETLRLGSLDPTDTGLRLFVERATAANDRFDLTDATRDSVIELCRHLDGIPLALELAASRTRSFTAAELLARLDDRFAVLRGGRQRGAMQRQRTLEAAIDWSYELLTEDEQRFFRHLGVFVGAFVFDVIPTVAEVPRDHALVLLDSLVAKSLVVPTPIDDEQTRYQLLETVQAYARQRLDDAGETEATAMRHEDAYVGYCTARTGWTSKHWTFCRAYRAQIADLWAATDHAIDGGRPERAVAILASGQAANDGSAYAAETLRRLTELSRTLGDDLPAGPRSVLAGALATAQLDASLFVEADATVRTGLARAHGVDIWERVELDVANLVMKAAIDPLAIDDLVDDLVRSLPNDPDKRLLITNLDAFRASAASAQRRYDDAAELALRGFRADRAYANDKACATHLWMAHLHGAIPAPEVVEFATSLEFDDTPYAISAHVAAAMCSEVPQPEIGHAVTLVADRMLSGRVPLEEAELLIAFARLALLRGDHERAAALAEVIGPRSPWTVTVLAEVVGTLGDWPTDEWSARTVALVLDRVGQLPELRDRAPALLADELDRWRTAPGS